MQFWVLFIFALLQGTLEWLPVSSEGQTVSVLVSFFNIDPQDAFKIAIFLHIGTLLAVSIKFRKELWKYINFREKDEEVVKWRWFLVYTTLGTAISGIPMFFIVKEYAVSPEVGEYIMLIIGAALIITGILLYAAKKAASDKKSIVNMTALTMIFVGILQGFSIIPGISRSGITMTGLLLLSVKKDEAIKGSFLMSIPAVLGGVILDISSSILSHEQILTVSVWQIILAIIGTAIIGYLTIETFLLIARRYNFAMICIILGLLTILLFVIRFL